MTRLFERLRLEAHFKGLRDRWGPEADSIVLDALERSWAMNLEIVQPEADQVEIELPQRPVPKLRIDDAILQDWFA